MARWWNECLRLFITASSLFLLPPKLDQYTIGNHYDKLLQQKRTEVTEHRDGHRVFLLYALGSKHCPSLHSFLTLFGRLGGRLRGPGLDSVWLSITAPPLIKRGEEDKRMTEVRTEIKTIQSILPLLLLPGIVEESLSRALFSVKCWQDNRPGKARDSETLQNMISSIIYTFPTAWWK